MSHPSISASPVQSDALGFDLPVAPYADSDYADYLADLAAREAEYHDLDADMECGYTDYDQVRDFDAPELIDLDDESAVDGYLRSRGYEDDRVSDEDQPWYRLMAGGYIDRP